MRPARLLIATALISLSFGPLCGFATADGVGVTSAVNQAAESERSGQMRTVKLGQSVFYNERISTNRVGLVQVLLVDGSTFTVGPDSDLVIDEFVYDADKDTGKLVASFTKGVARFVGGRLSKQQGGVTIRTRQGTVGVRGGMATLFEKDGQSVYSFLYGNGLTFNGQAGGTQRVYRPGFSVFGQNGTGTVGKTPPQLIASILALLAGQPGQNGGSGKKPSAGHLQAITSLNSDLPPSYIPPIPRPVLTTDPKRPLDGRLSIPDANWDYIRGQGTNCRAATAGNC